MKKAIVTWRDSRIYISQCNQEDEFEVCILESIGWILEEDKDKIVLAGDLVEGDARRIIAIPNENIIKKIKIN